MKPYDISSKKRLAVVKIPGLTSFYVYSPQVPSVYPGETVEIREYNPEQLDEKRRHIPLFDAKVLGVSPVQFMEIIPDDADKDELFQWTDHYDPQQWLFVIQFVKRFGKEF